MLSQSTKDRIKYALGNSDSGDELSTAIDTAQSESGTVALLDSVAAVSAIATADASDLSTLVALSNAVKTTLITIQQALRGRNLSAPFSSYFLTSDWETADGYAWLVNGTATYESPSVIDLAVPAATSAAAIFPSALSSSFNSYGDVGFFFTQTLADVTELQISAGILYFTTPTGYTAQLTFEPAGVALGLCTPLIVRNLTTAEVVGSAIPIPDGVRITAEPSGLNTLVKMYVSYGGTVDAPNWEQILTFTDTSPVSDTLAHVFYVYNAAGTPAVGDTVKINGYLGDVITP